MTSILPLGGFVLLICTSTALPALANKGGCPHGQVFVANGITVSGAFTRATLPNAPVGAGYLTIVNTGELDDRLAAVSSEISPSIELHTMSHADGVMTMGELPDGIAVPAGETVVLAPGGLHIMFIGPSQPFVEGECVEVVLEFENAGAVPVQLSVGPVGARSAPEGHDGHAGH